MDFSATGGEGDGAEDAAAAWRRSAVCRHWSRRLVKGDLRREGGLRSEWERASHPIPCVHSFISAPPCLLRDPDVSLSLLVRDWRDAVNHGLITEPDFPRAWAAARRYAQGAAGRRGALPAEDALRVWVLWVGVRSLLVCRVASLVCAGVARGGSQRRWRSDIRAAGSDWDVVRDGRDWGVGDAERKLWLCGACDLGGEHIDWCSCDLKSGIWLKADIERKSSRVWDRWWTLGRRVLIKRSLLVIADLKRSRDADERPVL